MADRRRRASSTARGYGSAHRRLRVQIARVVASGFARCARCGDPIVPGSLWDLDHDDRDRSAYLGPSHRACNRATKAIAFKRRDTSRAW